jgi:hypothetical protein
MKILVTPEHDPVGPKHVVIVKRVYKNANKKLCMKTNKNFVYIQKKQHIHNNMINKNDEFCKPEYDIFCNTVLLHMTIQQGRVSEVHYHQSLVKWDI